jgi:hypothetical protein
MIAELPAAERLARAIFADLSLYNADKMKAARDLRADLSAEIDEARRLFCARVTPALHVVFEERLGQWVAANGTLSAFPAAPRGAAESPLDGDPAVARGGGFVLMIAALLLAVAGATFWWFTRR